MTSQPSFDWTDVREYFEGLLPAGVAGLEELCRASGHPTKPTIGPWAAQLISVLILARRPGRVLEIGTSTGYSAIAMGRALKRAGGRLATIEIDPQLADLARRNVSEAHLADVVEVITGDANEVIAGLPPGFGVILQDGDKDDYVPMLPRLIKLLEPRGLLITDDVMFPVMEMHEEDKPLKDALAAYNQVLRGARELETVWLPIGDGVAVSVNVGA